MLAVVAPLIVFGLVIFIHELGHFIAAKLTGVYAPRFSIGFGPALLRHRHGETEYVLAALPLGGYVRMASRHDAETAFIEGGTEEHDGLKAGDAGYDPEAMIPFGPKPVPESRWFESKSLGARLFIMIAGVTMNFLLAFVVLSVLAFHFGAPVIATRVVGAVHAPANARALTALQPGDTMLAVNGRAIKSWSELLDRVEETPPGTLTFRTSRGEVSLPVGTPGAPTTMDVARAVDFFVPPVIGDVLPGSPAGRGGLQAGDSILTIGGAPVGSWSELQNRVGPAAGTALPFEVMRKGKRLSLVLHPEAASQKNVATGQMESVGKIGASVTDITTREPLGLGEALRAGARGTWVTAGSIVEVVRKLVTREVSVRQLGGPIAITRASVTAAKSGLESLFYLIAVLSVNVAILNLLPIPILDGGQILINVAESAKGSPFSGRTREYILRAGLVVILLIFAMSTFNDVVNGAKDLIVKLFG